MKVRFINFAILLVAIMAGGVFSSVSAQETEAVVIDQVVAQVNDGVITLSRVKREMQAATADLVQQSKMDEAKAKAEVEKKQGELIVNMINEELLMQKGKEIGVEKDVEVGINQRITQIMKDQGIKTIDELYKAMDAAGVKPDEFRESMRKQLTREEVFQNEVDRKVYYGLGAKEIKDYFDKHPEKFTKPESVTLSELFLGFAGRNEKDVRAKADKLVAELNKGGDFVKAVLENSDNPEAPKNKGLVGTFPVKDLNDKIGAAVKGLKVGQVTPVETEEGIEIVHVDERINAGSTAIFDENQIRNAMTMERLPEERRKYIAGLRKDAYVKISKDFVATTAPFLAEQAKTDAKAPTK